ncbi:CFEM domain-containing protein, partial [Colletotrichum tofieldiae]
LLPTLSIVLRLILKLSGLSPWGADDVSILLAYVILIGFLPNADLSEKGGAGRDLWTLSPNQIDTFLLALYILEILYHTSIALTKASILFLFIRVFPGEKLRIVLWATQAFNLLTAIVFNLAAIFQCQPVHLAWTGWSRQEEGRCFSMPHVGCIHGILNIVMDVWMLVLPLTQVLRLNMKWRNKFTVISMFSLGIFPSLQAIFPRHSPTALVGYIPTRVWTDTELYVGIFTACLPCTRQFFCRFILRRIRKKEKTIPIHTLENALKASPSGLPHA